MIINVSVSDKVNITQSQAPHTKMAEVSDTLFITDSVINHWINVSVSDAVGVIEELRSNPVAVHDNITITESIVTTGPIYAPVSDSVFITDNVQTVGEVITVSLFDTIDIKQVVNRNRPDQSVHDTLTITQNVVRNFVCQDKVNVIDFFTHDLSKGFFDTIDIVETVTPNITYAPKIITDTITIVDGVGYEIQLAPTTIVLTCPQTKTYSPNLTNVSGSHYAQIPATAPGTSRAPYIVLSYPFGAPTIVLALKNPEFNDLDKRTYKRIVRKTRGGMLKIFRDNMWPKYKRLNYTIHMVHEADANNLLNFFRVSLGKEIGLIDFENRQWKGIIITPEAGINYQVARIRAIQFEFEGDLV